MVPRVRPVSCSTERRTLPDGSSFVQHGLWGIVFGNGLSNQPVSTLFFAAGPNDEANGIYGRIDVKM